MTYKAFVSSTYEDLKDHRQHVIKALKDAGISVDPMENWIRGLLQRAQKEFLEQISRGEKMDFKQAAERYIDLLIVSYRLF